MPIPVRTVTDLLLPLDRTPGAQEGLTRQIYSHLRAAMLDGRLRAGDRLPPTRVLAQDLHVARLTVATAYDWLQAEGYVVGRIGAGTYVAPGLFERRSATPETADPLAAPATPEEDASRQRHLSAWARRIATISLAGSGTEPAAPFDFRPGIGAADAFPWERWRRMLATPEARDPLADLRLRERTASTGRWDALLGPIEARTAIAAWLRRSRAVRCAPEQVLTAGSVQQVLALLARLLVDPGQRLLVEDPSYIGFHAAFLAEGAVLEGVPVDASGLRTEELPLAVASATADAPRLLIVTPSHQYPTGVTLSLERRLALLRWAREAAVVLVEDDYDGDLRLEGQPLEALRGLDERDEVIYLGTFAKALYPAVRLAFAVLPHWLIEPVVRARAASDRHPSWREAITVARFIEAGELERHLARVRRLYRARRDALVAALSTHLGDVAPPGPADAGVHLLAPLPPGTDDVALAACALAQGISVGTLSPHYRQGGRPGLLLGFGALPEEAMDGGIQRLAPLVRAAVAAAS